MITLHINNNDFDQDEKIVAYINKKIGGLDKYLPRNLKDTVTGTVILTHDASGRENNEYIFEALINVPGPNIQAKEATLNMYAAIDIVEAKLRAQMVKFKDKHSPKSRRGVIFMNKVLGRGVRLEPIVPDEVAEGL